MLNGKISNSNVHCLCASWGIMICCPTFILAWHVVDHKKYQYKRGNILLLELTHIPHTVLHRVWHEVSYIQPMVCRMSRHVWPSSAAKIFWSRMHYRWLYIGWRTKRCLMMMWDLWLMLVVSRSKVMCGYHSIMYERMFLSCEQIFIPHSRVWVYWVVKILCIVFWSQLIKWALVYVWLALSLTLSWTCEKHLLPVYLMPIVMCYS